MNGELVYTVTDDNVRLDGFFCETASQTTTNIDAVIIVHGLSGNFYKSKFLKHVATALRNEGIHSLLVNTRGHDYLNSTTRSGRADTLGAAVEVIDDCRQDIYAWIEFLNSKQLTRVLVFGHSLGAIKALYAQAHRPHQNVVAVAAYSATKLSYDSLLASSGGDRFVHWINTSMDWVAAGKGEDFMFVDFPFPTWMSANAYLAKYGDGDKNNWLKFYHQISVPVLAAFGGREMEENAAFQTMKPDLASIDLNHFTVKFIDNADHFYSACYESATKILFDWLATI